MLVNETCISIVTNTFNLNAIGSHLLREVAVSKGMVDSAMQMMG
jgi:hypothetical protein